jgi:hypothetical protein
MYRHPSFHISSVNLVLLPDAAAVYIADYGIITEYVAHYSGDKLNNRIPEYKRYTHQHGDNNYNLHCASARLPLSKSFLSAPAFIFTPLSP